MADRIEREIEEILKKIDNFVPDGPKPRARRTGGASGGSSASRHWFSRISMRKVMMWALVAALIAFFLRGIPGGYWLLIGALIIFVVAFLLSTRNGGGSAATASEKRWRGQPLDLSEPSFMDKLKARFKGKGKGKKRRT